ncbi:MAG: ABC transporter substrate-binding protein, partial [Acidimicrobiia bacterium]|nr:ABC transporter substrate-binding protein [Acidimicrobiia bacterium]
TEAVLWGAFIEQHLEELGGSAKVAALVTTNDFGAAYESGFKAFLAQSPNADKIEYVTERVEPSAVNLKDPMTTIAAGEPDVFIGMLVGTPCSQAMTESAENGMNEAVAYKFISSVCKSSSFVGRDKVGEASDGWWVVGGGQKDINAPTYEDDAFIQWGQEVVRAAGHDPSTSGSFGSGLFYYWAYVQALRIAGELPGGLTRTNFLLAARTMDMTHPYLLEGIRFNFDGNADAYAVEGSDVSRYDAAQQAWVQDGPIIDLSGQSDNCAWDASAGICG